MKNIKTLIPCLFLLTGCSTYIKVRDFRVPKLAPQRGSILEVKITDDNDFGPVQKRTIIGLIQESLARENLLSLSVGKPNKKDEVAKLTLAKTYFDCSCHGSINVAEDGKETRDATAVCKVNQIIRLSQGKDSQILDVQTSSSKSNEIVVPKAPSKSSLRPIFNALLDMKSEREKAIENQDEVLILQARAGLQDSINNQILSSIIPISFDVRQKFDDSEDFENVEEQVKNGNYSRAINLLLPYPDSGPKFYNLALLYDSLQRNDELDKAIKWLDVNSRKDLHVKYIAHRKARERRKESLKK